MVQDGPELLALYGRPGAEFMVPADPNGRVFNIHSLVNMDWELERRRWENHVLRLVTPGSSHSVWLLWRESWELICWYINLEEPMTRTSLGFDYFDQQLDIVASPDLTEWRWKDEDEFEEAQALGLISEERARELRAEGEHVIKLMKARKTPFNQGWESWRPDPAWPIPQLPAGWDVIG